MEKDLCGIYKITCVVNQKCYIGQSVNIKERWKSHRTSLRHNNHSNKYLQSMFNKYGEENIKYEILEECLVEQLDDREKYWISFYGGVESKQNCNWESGGHKNKRFSKELRQLQSERHKGQHSSPATQFKKGLIPWNKGKKATKEAILHQSESHKGLKVSEETKRKLSKALKGKYVGKQRYNAKGVLKMDINGNIVAQYDTLVNAGKAEGIASGNIMKRAKHSNKLYNNYYWRLKEN